MGGLLTGFCSTLMLFDAQTVIEISMQVLTSCFLLRLAPLIAELPISHIFDRTTKRKFNTTSALRPAPPVI
jgi:hypothetical protein